MSAAFEVHADDEGNRLDAWLAGVSGLSRSEVQRRVSAGLVIIGGSTAVNSHKLVAGECVELTNPADTATDDGEVPFEIRFEDDDLAIVYKPSGVIVHPAPGNSKGTLVGALGRIMPLAGAAGEHRPGIVHRLDKDTSGAIVVAKTDATYYQLVAMMRRREIKRTYAALVAGSFDLPAGRIEAPMARSRQDPTRIGVSPKGKAAATLFRVVLPLLDMSLIDVELETGRTHQIRVHFAHISHPVIGDKIYGRTTLVMAKSIGLQRMFLHARSLEFIHPSTGVPLAVHEPLPTDLGEALDRSKELAK